MSAKIVLSPETVSSLRYSLKFFVTNLQLDSRVKCSNCEQSKPHLLTTFIKFANLYVVGHTKVRCKEPLKEEDGGNDNYGGGDDAGGGDNDNYGATDNFEEPVAAAATGGEDSWGGGGGGDAW